MTLLKENMKDCETSNDFALYFKEYNQLTVDTYCRLALTKLKNLSDKQINDLNNIIMFGNVKDVSDLDLFGWDAYCYVLNNSQIEYVGW